MSHPNPERDERLNEIRGNRRNFYGGMGQLTADIDYLLSLLDSQADETCLHCKKPIRRIGSAWLHVENKLVSCRRGKSQEHNGIYRAEPATKESIATRMRDRCVERMKGLRDEWESKRNESEPLSKMRNRYDAAFCAANEAIKELQSLTLEQGEQEK